MIRTELKREDLLCKKVTFTLSAKEVIFPAENDCEYQHTTDLKPNKYHFKEMIVEMYERKYPGNRFYIFNGNFEVNYTIKKTGYLDVDTYGYDLDDDEEGWGYIERMHDVEYEVVMKCAPSIAELFEKHCEGKYPGKFTIRYEVYTSELDITVLSIEDV